MKPRHIAIIPDGNRRFAKENGFKKEEGHAKGAEKVSQLITWFRDFEIPELTLYGFSEQNFSKRSEEEKSYLFALIETEAIKLINNYEELREKNTKINYIGRLNKLPVSLQDRMHELMSLTKSHSKLTINIALAYGGIEEITDAFKAMAQKVLTGKLSLDKITEEEIKNNLYLNSDVDIVIRTGKERRVSNFLLWQASYAEIFFLGKYWPEFEKSDLEYVLKEFERIDRRFGK